MGPRADSHGSWRPRGSLGRGAGPPLCWTVALQPSRCAVWAITEGPQPFSQIGLAGTPEPSVVMPTVVGRPTQAFSASVGPFSVLMLRFQTRTTLWVFLIHQDRRTKGFMHPEKLVCTIQSLPNNCFSTNKSDARTYLWGQCDPIRRTSTSGPETCLDPRSTPYFLVVLIASPTHMLRLYFRLDDLLTGTFRNCIPRRILSTPTGKPVSGRVDGAKPPRGADPEAPDGPRHRHRLG